MKGEKKETPELWQQPVEAQIQVFYLYMGLLFGIFANLFVACIMTLVVINVEDTRILSIALVITIIVCVILIYIITQEVRDSINHMKKMVRKYQEVEEEAKSLGGEPQPPAG